MMLSLIRPPHVIRASPVQTVWDLNEVSQALKAYAMMASSASDGAVRVLPDENTDA